jgi:hypothetical protein
MRAISASARAIAARRKSMSARTASNAGCATSASKVAGLMFQCASQKLRYSGFTAGTPAGTRSGAMARTSAAVARPIARASPPSAAPPGMHSVTQHAAPEGSSAKVLPPPPTAGSARGVAKGSASGASSASTACSYSTRAVLRPLL